MTYDEDEAPENGPMWRQLTVQRDPLWPFFTTVVPVIVFVIAIINERRDVMVGCAIVFGLSLLAQLVRRA